MTGNTAATFSAGVPSSSGLTCLASSRPALSSALRTIWFARSSPSSAWKALIIGTRTRASIFLCSIQGMFMGPPSWARHPHLLVLRRSRAAHQLHLVSVHLHGKPLAQEAATRGLHFGAQDVQLLLAGDGE